MKIPPGGDESLTHYGGVYLLHRFLSRIGFKAAIAKHVSWRERNTDYTVGESLLALLYPMMLGIERVETARLLKHNGVFQYLTGLPTYPDPTTLRRFLTRFASTALPKLRAVHDHFLQHMITQTRKSTRLIFDIDSTVLALYGRQEKAGIGYNPIKKGRPSYHPLLCFEGHTQDFWHGEFRSGTSHTATGVQNLLEASFAKANF